MFKFIHYTGHELREMTTSNITGYPWIVNITHAILLTTIVFISAYLKGLI
jgi:hypothetical protein